MADYSHDVTIKGNLIRHTGYSHFGPNSTEAAGLTISGDNDGGLGNTDIRIEGNTFADVRGVNLKITHARSISIQANTFRSTHAVSKRDVGDIGIDPSAVVWLADCRDVRFADNLVDGMGPHATRAVGFAPTARDVSGLPDGMTIKGR